MQYELLDSGNQKKLERFGPYILDRPSSQAVWEPSLSQNEWDKADAIFRREPDNHWSYKRKLPASWEISIDGIIMKIAPSDFGHVGVFPEHTVVCRAMKRSLLSGKRFLNLFGYTGLATIAAAKEKAHVCHVDASKPMVQRAKENVAFNSLQKAPIRWIVDDAMKFLKREVKRKSLYDGILLDPPTFGRGAQGEIFKIERDLIVLLKLCKDCLVQKPSFVILSSHTPGFTSLVLEHALEQTMMSGNIHTEEMVLACKNGFSLPSGIWSLWQP